MVDRVLLFCALHAHFVGFYVLCFVGKVYPWPRIGLLSLGEAIWDEPVSRYSGTPFFGDPGQRSSYAKRERFNPFATVLSYFYDKHQMYYTAGPIGVVFSWPVFAQKGKPFGLPCVCYLST